MTIGYGLITQDSTESVQSWVAAVSAYLSGLGLSGLQDVQLTRLEALGKRGRLRCTIVSASGGPLSLAAAYFGATSGPQLPDAQAATFFAANPLYRALFIRDVGEEHRGGLDANAIMIVYGTTPLSNCGQSRSRPMIVQALANIASGATGSAQLVSASGLVAGSVISVVNRFDTTWLSGTRGYATPRAGSCVFDGFKTCC
jgi:hypothetical protein